MPDGLLQSGGDRMLVTRRADHLTLITQPEHARLAGRLAELWGNERFAVPAARRALIIAATHHDDGWLELDGRPAHNEQAARPAHFTEMPSRVTVGPYARGVESVYARDLRGGALVGMHFSGFYTGRWGLAAGGAPPSDPIAADVVATQEARWMPALRDSWAYQGPRSAFDAATWHAYEVLQALDLLSLAFGLSDLSQPSGDAAPIPVTETLRRIDPPPGPRIVPAVPVAAGGERVDLTVRVTAPWRVQIDPYPFAEASFELPLEMRELDDRIYASPEDTTQAFHAAPVGEQRLAIAAGPDA
jgi:Protein of unknown function (DUF3891)